MTPDGHRYLAASSRRVARPFHYRWLLPRVCGTDPRRWIGTAYGSAVLYLAMVWVYSGSWVGPVLALGLAGVIRFNVRNPVLVDLPAQSLGLAAAVSAREGLWWLAVLLVLVAGCVKESAPVFAALWAWSPVLLVGLIPVAVRHLQQAGTDQIDAENRWILEHPFGASWKYHKRLPGWVWVLPWGICLVGLAGSGWQLACTVLVAYAQCLVATDTVRLYQWAAPVVIASTIGLLPDAWLVPVLAVHLANPFRTEGV